MAGIIGNYVIAYGFVVPVTHPRYFVNPRETDMRKKQKVKQYKHLLNEVGWFALLAEKKGQSRLYVLGERILSVEDDTLKYFYGDNRPRFHNVEREVFQHELRDKKLIDSEAAINKTRARYLLFMNDKLEQAI